MLTKFFQDSFENGDGKKLKSYQIYRESAEQLIKDKSSVGKLLPVRE